MESPVLVLPDNCKPYKVEVDTSNFAVGGILSQEQDDGKWRLVAYTVSHMPCHQPSEIMKFMTKRCSLS